MYRSKNIRLGNDTKFSILVIWLCYKFNSLSLSSPSSKGICDSSLLSKLSLSGLAFLSDGFLYTTSTPGI